VIGRPHEGFISPSSVLLGMARDFEKAWRERLVKANLDLIILRLLKSKPRWGYEINMAIRDRYKVYLSAGTLYPLLHSLEDGGRIEGVWESEKGRGRRIYRITESGLAFLSAGEKMTADLVKLMQTMPDEARSS
jgi:PadR family transcriptional regulator PadR